MHQQIREVDKLFKKPKAVANKDGEMAQEFDKEMGNADLVGVGEWAVDHNPESRPSCEWNASAE